MMKLVLALLLSTFLLAATGRSLLKAGESVSIEQQSDNGGCKLERPAYKVLNDTAELQIREYENGETTSWSLPQASLHANSQKLFSVVSNTPAAYSRGALSAWVTAGSEVAVVTNMAASPFPPAESVY